MIGTSPAIMKKFVIKIYLLLWSGTEKFDLKRKQLMNLERHFTCVNIFEFRLGFQIVKTGLMDVTERYGRWLINLRLDCTITSGLFLDFLKHTPLLAELALNLEL